MPTPPEFIAALPLVRLAAGEVLIEEGSPPMGLFFLVRGSVEVLKKGQSIARVRDFGAVFGEMSLLLGAPHTATVRAMTDAEFHRAEPDLETLRGQPGLALYVAEILARRLEALDTYLADLKIQFGDRGDHLGMVDGILDTLMTKHPRKIERRDAGI